MLCQHSRSVRPGSPPLRDPETVEADADPGERRQLELEAERGAVDHPGILVAARAIKDGDVGFRSLRRTGDKAFEILEMPVVSQEELGCLPDAEAGADGIALVGLSRRRGDGSLGTGGALADATEYPIDCTGDIALIASGAYAGVAGRLARLFGDVSLSTIVGEVSLNTAGEFASTPPTAAGRSGDNTLSAKFGEAVGMLDCCNGVMALETSGGLTIATGTLARLITS